MSPVLHTHSRGPSYKFALPATTLEKHCLGRTSFLPEKEGTASVHCSREGDTTVQRSGHHCPLKWPQAGQLRLPIPNPVRKQNEAHTTNGFSRAVKTVRTQGCLETLLYPRLQFQDDQMGVHLFPKWRAQLRSRIYEKILSSWFVQTPRSLHQLRTARPLPLRILRSRPGL